MARGFHPFRNSDSPSSASERNNNLVRQPNMDSLRNRLTLPINQMAIPIYTAPSREEVEVGGRVLFQNFIHEELEHEGLPDDVLEVQEPPPGAHGDVGPDYVLRNRSQSPSLASTPEGYTNAQWMQIGSNIRELANQFASSRQRPLIKQQADQVDLAHINQESFFNMLSVIFKNGIDKHCIVALFFFCSDVLIRCAKQQLRELGARLFLWSLKFLVDRVCRWVYDNGGWEKVFSNIYKVVFRVSALVALGIVITCGIVYVRKNW